MTYFEQALSAPALHFRRLRQAEPVLCNGVPIVRRTYSAIESEIVWEGRNYLLMIPLEHDSLVHIAHLEEISKERSRGILSEMRILCEELRMIGSLGQEYYLDVILQDQTNGTPLTEAVMQYRAEDLRNAVIEMKKRLDAIGFLHNNLRPPNVIICSSGKARPLRYWYAQWETFSDNDISQLTAFIDSHDYPDSNLQRLPLCPQKEAYEKEPETEHEGITRCYKAGHYGFVDNDGHQITKFIYSWASDFCEGRAIVAKCNKMGVINSNGKTIIPTIYKEIKFNVDRGVFIATNDHYRYLIDYNGNRLKRIAENEYSDNKEAILA